MAAAAADDDVAPPTASGYLDPSYWFAPSLPLLLRPRLRFSARPSGVQQI